MNISPAERSVIAKLRFGVLPISIETGRYTSVPMEQRICTLCNLDEVETEYHFVFICDRYQQFRNNLLSKLNISDVMFRTYNLQEKFKLLFSAPKYLGQYLIESLELRKSIIFK